MSQMRNVIAHVRIVNRCENNRTFTHLSKKGDTFSQVIEAFRIYLSKKKDFNQVREYSVSGVRGEGASSKRWRV